LSFQKQILSIREQKVSLSVLVFAHDQRFGNA
jgi:hypothetical protein